jgi:hypothetical protein
MFLHYSLSMEGPSLYTRNSRIEGGLITCESARDVIVLAIYVRNRDIYSLEYQERINPNYSLAR